MVGLSFKRQKRTHLFYKKEDATVKCLNECRLFDFSKTPVYKRVQSDHLEGSHTKAVETAENDKLSFSQSCVLINQAVGIMMLAFQIT